jgi:hypothetical protein
MMVAAEVDSKRLMFAPSVQRRRVQTTAVCSGNEPECKKLSAFSQNQKAES